MYVQVAVWNKLFNNNNVVAKPQYRLNLCIPTINFQIFLTHVLVLKGLHMYYLAYMYVDANIGATGAASLKTVYLDYWMGIWVPTTTSALMWHNSAGNTATFSNKQLYVKSIYTFYESIQIFVRWKHMFEIHE